MARSRTQARKKSGKKKSDRQTKDADPREKPSSPKIDIVIPENLVSLDIGDKDLRDKLGSLGIGISDTELERVAEIVLLSELKRKLGSLDLEVNNLREKLGALDIGISDTELVADVENDIPDKLGSLDIENDLRDKLGSLKLIDKYSPPSMDIQVSKCHIKSDKDGVKTLEESEKWTMTVVLPIKEALLQIMDTDLKDKAHRVIFDDGMMFAEDLLRFMRNDGVYKEGYTCDIFVTPDVDRHRKT